MPIRPASFDAVATQLAPLLENLPGRLIAIDGRMGAGKSTLGRFLAWYFNVTLVETDPFLQRDGTLSRRTDEIKRIVSDRFECESPRPVLIEGVGMRELLQVLGRAADAHIYVTNVADRNEVDPLVLKYEANFKPRENATFLVEVTHEG